MTTDARLPDELSIYTVGELHLLWLGWASAASDSDTLHVSASEVQQADAAGVQLLLSLHAALARRQRSLRLASPSTALQSACTALGLGDWLGSVTLQEEQAA